MEKVRWDEIQHHLVSMLSAYNRYMQFTKDYKYVYNTSTNAFATIVLLLL